MFRGHCFLRVIKVASRHNTTQLQIIHGRSALLVEFIIQRVLNRLPSHLHLGAVHTNKLGGNQSFGQHLGNIWSLLEEARQLRRKRFSTLMLRIQHQLHIVRIKLACRHNPFLHQIFLRGSSPMKIGQLLFFLLLFFAHTIQKSRLGIFGIIRRILFCFGVRQTVAIAIAIVILFGRILINTALFQVLQRRSSTMKQFNRFAMLGAFFLHSI
mmetsp:Transcript_40041/g.65643  ORF Transcript_40041/g.65643 Transcript_40041/m.65643 type:complete len:212 (-) Transcript_40041:1604-2239(-)